jgi:hypothetical protein
MRRISPADVNSVRTIVTWCVRAAALFLLATGAYLFLKKLCFALGYGSGGFEHMFRVHMDIGEGQSTYRGLAMLLVGAALALGARRIARWVVSPPEQGCPRCGYAGAVTDTCPECGQSGLPQQ